MKRLYVLLMAALILSASSISISAQEKGTLRFHYSLGLLSLPDYLGAVIVGLGSIDTSDGVSSHSFLPLANLNAGLEYHFNEKVSLGATLSLSGSSAWTTIDANGEINRKIAGFYPSLCVSSTTRYFKHNLFSMYGHWGVGASFYMISQYFRTETPPSSFNGAVTPAGNIYPLCFSWGRKAGFNLECGWGSKGFVNIGGYVNI